MLLRRTGLLMAALLLSHAGLSAADKPALADGKYLLSYQAGIGGESRIAVLELKTEDGKTKAEMLDGGPSKWVVSDFKLDGKSVTAKVTLGTNKLSFEGKVDAKDPKIALGSFGDDSRINLGKLAPTELEAITRETSFAQTALPDEYKDLQKLRSEPFRLSNLARAEKDADKRKELLDQSKAAKVKADTEAPAILKKIYASEVSPIVTYFVGQELMASAGASKAKPADVKAYAEKYLAVATSYGTRVEQQAIATVAETLSGQEGFGEVALPYAEKFAASVEKAPIAKQSRALKALLQAQTKAGKADAAKITAGKVAKIEDELDAEYKKTSLNFKPAKFEGRKDKESSRVAVFELFTGATCPPCVAADLAFDALEQTYTPKDVVLIQHHQHIPGPDPMTNPDTVARWDYYRKLFPKEMGGVPSSVFNGKPLPGGGGPKENAKKKYDEYSKVIGEILDGKTDLKIEGGAQLVDGSVKVSATVKGMKASESHKLRFLLVEEEIRYAGSNGIRFHHQVVRSAFGKNDGWALADLKGEAKASVNLEDLRKKLGVYLEDYNKNERPFANPERPLGFNHLKVIVLVQDDETGEILQGAQFDVTGGKS